MMKKCIKMGKYISYVAEDSTRSLKIVENCLISNWPTKIGNRLVLRSKCSLKNDQNLQKQVSETFFVRDGLFDNHKSKHFRTS